MLFAAALAALGIGLFVSQRGFPTAEPARADTPPQPTRNPPLPSGFQGSNEQIKPTEERVVTPVADDTTTVATTAQLDRLMEVKTFQLQSLLAEAGHPQEAADIGRFLAKEYLRFVNKLVPYSSRIEHEGVATTVILVPPEQAARFEAELRNAVSAEFGSAPFTEKMWARLGADFLDFGKYPMALMVTPATPNPAAPIPYYEWTLTVQDHTDPDAPHKTLGGFVLAPGLESLFGDLVSQDRL